MTDCLKSSFMKKNFFLFLFLISIFPYTTYAQDEKKPGREIIEREKLDMKSFRELMECYYAYYFEYPKDMETFIGFEKCYIHSYPDDWPDDEKDLILNSNIPFFEHHKDDIQIVRSDSDVVIRWDDWILYDALNPWGDPCELSEYLSKYPDSFEPYYFSVYRRLYYPRYYDHAGKAIIVIEELDSLYKESMGQLRKKYLKKGKFILPVHTFVSRKETLPIFTPFEYQPDIGLHYFCKKDERFESDLLFFKAFEDFLKDFCLTHGIARMVFLCTEYTPVRKNKVSSN